MEQGASMLGLIIKHRWALLAGLFVASTGGAILYGYFKGSSNAKIKIVYEQVEIMEKRGEIARHRPDAAGVVKRLRDGTF